MAGIRNEVVRGQVSENSILAGGGSHGEDNLFPAKIEFSDT